MINTPSLQHYLAEPPPSESRLLSLNTHIYHRCSQMTSESPPPKIPSVTAGTPAKEWSQSVLASSGQESDTSASHPTIPGSFDVPVMGDPEPEPEQVSKSSKEPEKRESETTQGSKETTTTDQPTLAQSAKQYVPEQSVKETVSSYLSHGEPQHEEHHVSLPSTELKGAQPMEHTGGVGALPGNVSESSVALLPDERQEREAPSIPPQRERRDTIKPSAVPIVAGSEQTQPQEPAPLVDTSVPEAEDQKQAAPAVVGTVPGAEELAEKKQDLGAPEKLAEEKGPTRDEREEENKQARPPTKEGYGGDYHPAELHPPPLGESVEEYRAAVAGQKEEEHETPASPTQSKRRVSGAAGKKPGLMQMVKGEVKIITGKMSGDEEKVAEGKRLMHREAK